MELPIQDGTEGGGSSTTAREKSTSTSDRLEGTRSITSEVFPLAQRGKSHGKVVTAVARELIGFVWAIACVIEQTLNTKSIA